MQSESERDDVSLSSASSGERGSHKHQKGGCGY